MTADNQILLHPNESIYIPFKYMTYFSDGNSDSNRITVNFINTQMIGSKSVQVIIKPKNAIVQKHLFCYCSENSYFKHTFFLPMNDVNFSLHTRN